MLLIWDNFETAHSMPDPDHPTRPADEDGHRDLRDFLGRIVHHGHSTVLITSRSPEPWLGDIGRIPVGGLTAPEANQYATYLLRPTSAVPERRSMPTSAQRREQPAFGELMEWLDGHPLSMRLILPHVETTEPAVLLNALRGTVPLPGVADTNDRMTSLPASIAFSFHHLSGKARLLLPVLCVLQRAVTVHILVMLCSLRGTPERFRGATLEGWLSVLAEAVGVGLLTPLRPGMYQLHPALPAYLAAAWRQEEPAGFDDDRNTVNRAAVAAYGQFCQWLRQEINKGNTEDALAITGIEHHNLTTMLGYALAHGLWDEAREIISPLYEYWETRGLDAEARAWTDRVGLAASPGASARSLDHPATLLWLGTSIKQVQIDDVRLHLDHAHGTASRIRAWLEARPRSALRQEYLATVYGMLWKIARVQGRPDDSQRWGHMAQHAMDEIPKTRHDSENLTGRREAARLRRLGEEAQERGRLDEAEQLYRGALAISLRAGDKPGMATAYEILGHLALGRTHLSAAEDLYRKALPLYEDLDNKAALSLIYDSLGVLCYGRRQLDEAGDWYRKALAIAEEQGNLSGAAVVLQSLSALARTQGQERQALEWAIKCVALFEEFPHPHTEREAQQLRKQIRRLGTRTLEEAWWTTTGTPLPQAVRDYVESGEADG